VFLRKTLQLPWKWGTEHEKARRIALAQCNLAVSFHHGNGVGQDKKEAVKYYRLTAEQGNSFRTLSVSGQMEDLLHKDHKEFDQQKIPETAGELLWFTTVPQQFQVFFVGQTLCDFCAVGLPGGVHPDTERVRKEFPCSAVSL
jgi:hypothetical protein